MNKVGVLFLQKNCFGMKNLLVLMALFGLCVSACQRQESAATKEGRGGEEEFSPPVHMTVAQFEPVLTVPTKVGIYEDPSEVLLAALPWRGATLVLFADNPLLAPLPQSIQAEIQQSLAGNPGELSQRLGRITNPLLMPEMTVRAALVGKVFSRIVWVVPSANMQEQLDMEKFGELLKSAGLDKASFQKGANGTLSGKIEGVPFDVVHPAALPKLSEPVLVHIDLGYFVSLYRTEIKTPLLPLVGSTLVKLRATKWQTKAVTFSYSNHTGSTPLSMRPLGPIIERLFAEPQLLDQKLPENWDLWGKALYLENFFNYDEIRRVLGSMEKNTPSDPGVNYVLYSFNRHQRDLAAAEQYLAKAVAGDRGYALEYMTLAEEMREKKRPDLVLNYIRKLVAAYPDDPLFQLTLCEELIEQKQFAAAQKILSSLLALPWSPVYYPEVVPTLEQFQKLI